MAAEDPSAAAADAGGAGRAAAEAAQLTRVTNTQLTDQEDPQLGPPRQTAATEVNQSQRNAGILEPVVLCDIFTGRLLPNLPET